MKKIMQFRYYGDGDTRNHPSGLTTTDWSTNLLKDYGVVSHLGIQAEPGTVFYLNFGGSPIYIGETGIYELDLEGIGRIYGIRFDKDILTSIYTSNPSPDHRVIVDIIYEGSGV